MNGEGEGGVVAWLIDGAAAITFAAAAAFAGGTLLGPIMAAAGGVAGFGLSMLFLRSVQPRTGRHRIAGFEPIDWETLPEPIEEAPVRGPEEDVLVLEDVLSVPADSRVVQLFPTPSLPSPGELKARIDAHLAGKPPAGKVVQLPVDASAALREALADLRRSLG